MKELIEWIVVIFVFAGILAAPCFLIKKEIVKAQKTKDAKRYQIYIPDTWARYYTNEITIDEQGHLIFFNDEGHKVMFSSGSYQCTDRTPNKE